MAKKIKVELWETIKGFRFQLPLLMIYIEKISSIKEIKYALRFPNGKEEILDPKIISSDEMRLKLSSGFNVEGNPISENQHVDFLVAFRSIFGTP